MTVLENLMLVARQQRGEHLFHAWFSPRTVHREEEAALAKAEEVLRFLELRHLAQVMNQGAHLAEGSPEEVRHQPAVLEAYMGGAL